MPFNRTAFTRDLANWFRTAQRDLPWRHPENARDPYRVLVSEFMLQQTTVAAVIPFFHKFIARFPDVQTLAAAPEEDVLAHWAGLGYYARARNLQRTAREVVDLHGGQFPSNADSIQALPGIGRYTAGAVASIALGERAPIVDANVARVLTRVCLIEGDLKSTANQTRLWEEATRLIREIVAAPAETNPGLMELGALICTPRNPRCEACPVAAHCGAYSSGRQDELPFIPAKKALTPLHDVCAFASKEEGGTDFVLMRRRPDTPGIWWRGMWELPRTTANAGESAYEALKRLGQELTLQFAPGDKIHSIKHGVTRYTITLDCHEVHVEPLEPGSDVQPSDWQWVDWETALTLPLPSSMRSLLKHLQAKPARQLSLL